MAVGGDGSVSGQSTGHQDSEVRGQGGDQGPASLQRDLHTYPAEGSLSGKPSPPPGIPHDPEIRTKLTSETTTGHDSSQSQLQLFTAVIILAGLVSPVVISL